MAAEPKCPSCNVVEIRNIVSTPSAKESKSGDTWFYVAVGRS